MSQAAQYSDTNTGSAPQVTLKQINEALGEAGFPLIDPELMIKMKAHEPRHRIINAINIAKHDSGARAFLTNLFTTCGMQIGTRGNQAPANHQAQMSPTPTDAAKHGTSLSQAPMNTHQEQAVRTTTQNRPAPATRGSAPEAEAPKLAPEDRFSYHVYGGKAALCFESDLTRNSAHTVALDAANTTGPRTYDWGKKVRIQLTRSELPVVAAVFVGARPRCEFKNHGQENNKGFSMERQGEKVFVKVFSANEPLKAVPIEAADVFYVATMLIRQIRKNAPWMDATAITNLLYSTQGTGSA